MADVITVEPDVDEVTGPAQAPAATGSGGDTAAPRTSHRARSPRSSSWRMRLVGLTAALVVLATGDVLLLTRAGDPVAAQREPALAAARQVAMDISSIGAENAQDRLARLDAATTGSFREGLSGYAALLQDMLRQGRVTSRATVTATGLEHIDADTATALVSVTATVTDAAMPGGEERHYRLAIQLLRDGDRWLASSVAYVQ